MKDSFICKEDYRPLIPNKTFEAQCISYDAGFSIGRARKLFLHFQISEPGEYNGKKLFMAFNMPTDDKIRPGSKYYKTWVLVNGWRKPSRNTKMSPRIFKGKIFLFIFP